LVLGLTTLVFGVGIIFLIIAGVAYFYGSPCPSCGVRGTTVFVRSETVNQEPAYGIITRTDTIRKRRTRPDGTVVREVTNIDRQERVPVVRTTTRRYYRCKNCQNSWSRDFVSQSEDFARRETPPQRETVIVQKEVMKVPCRYCGTLVDPVTNSKCPSCGGKIL
jgi:hypothetical protein